MQAMRSLEGHLLVASPYLVNSPFSQAVVLVLQHTTEAAWGVVLNRSAGETIRSFWQKVSDEPCAIDRPVNVGGPLSGPVLAVHRCQELAEAAFLPGVFVATDKDRLQALVQQSQGPLRLFVGLSGWTAGQLEQELDAGLWLTLPATVEQVFSDEDELWQKTLREVGHSFTRSLGIKHIPEDVSRN
jgi:putative transcriptional regulator